MHLYAKNIQNIQDMYMQKYATSTLLMIYCLRCQRATLTGPCIFKLRPGDRARVQQYCRGRASSSAAAGRGLELRNDPETTLRARLRIPPSRQTRCWPEPGRPNDVSSSLCGQPWSAELKRSCSTKPTLASHRDRRRPFDPAGYAEGSPGRSGPTISTSDAGGNMNTRSTIFL